MYVGDTLLNHYNEEEIKSFYQNSSYYRDKAFAVIFVDRNSNMYDRIQVTLKPGDNEHKIFSLEGIIDFDKEIEFVTGDEWKAGNLSYHIKSRPKWEGFTNNEVLNSSSQFICVDDVCLGRY